MMMRFGKRVRRGIAGVVVGCACAAGALAAGLPPGVSEEDVLRELRSRGMDDGAIQAALSGGGGSEPGRTAPADIPEPAREVLEEGSAAPPPPPPPPPVKGGSDLARFGESLFSLAPSTFAPPAYGPIDPGYRIGPGDEIVIDLWGDAVFRLEKVVSREGTVLLADVGQVSLSGLTLAEAEERVHGQLSKAYSGLGSTPQTAFLDVSLGKLRPIKVFVVGETRRPGAYDLSAASTVFHALYYAGGASPRGSLRDVRVVRGGEVVAHLDVYDYLLHGTRDGDIRLEDDDTVFLPVRGKRIALRGEVRRPALYELLAGETLADAVKMAGGITGTTYLDRAHVNRVVPPRERDLMREDRVVVDVHLGRVLAGEESFALQDLDDVKLLSVADLKRNYVEIRGHVRMPGTFELKEGMRVRDLVMRADSLKGEAYLARAFVVRTREDFTRETLTFDLGAAIAGADAENIPLEAWDEVAVYSIWDLRDRETVRVTGAVRRPGEYERTDRMTLGELLVRAGGFEEHAFTEEVEVSRVYPENGDRTRIADVFRVEIAEGFLESGDLPAFALENHDHVFVRKLPHWELQRNVMVTGEVLFPGAYTLRTPTETLADVLDRAGGLLETAYPEGFRMERKFGGAGRVSVDLVKALADRDSDQNLVLASGDELMVPERPMTVKVSGAVGLPTSLVYRAGKGIGFYVRNAGGYLDTAKRSEVKIVYSTGRAEKVRRFWFDPGVEPGSQIVVPAMAEEEGTDWGEVVRDVTAVLASLATTVLVIDRVGG
ncbi:MAG: SLBB domain-containing protein [Gemmatimonadota bacterium]|jgi:protein involved in polysaccharide export with SLBB domain|nr:hypothetical protein [Gemmatimonadota bacterium]MDP6460511.1 SLBB domain-containing protein [Gemmatimonadota bacterium]MDP6528385.1 SLBB domain-containing protein [Gemmatimonadota bacterium]MDP6802841.1 SLBB domain-containing protein [Gemmatimonadota bacterium]MDP7031054.1 SLBB domain-containing protein [Gemmatimonadota bacterium]